MVFSVAFWYVMVQVPEGVVPAWETVRLAVPGPATLSASGPTHDRAMFMMLGVVGELQDQDWTSNVPAIRPARRTTP